MGIIKNLKLADFVTLLNIAAGIVSITLSIKGKFEVASVLLLASVIFDAIDGRLSRKFGKQNNFGKELDSLADIVSFGAAPVALVVSFVPNTLFLVIAASFFVICGALRLSRFNITDKPYFEGLPITPNGVIFPIFYFLKLPHGIYPYAFILIGILMISSFKVAKLFRGK